MLPIRGGGAGPLSSSGLCTPSPTGPQREWGLRGSPNLPHIAPVPTLFMLLLPSAPADSHTQRHKSKKPSVRGTGGEVYCKNCTKEPSAGRA